MKLKMSENDNIIELKSKCCQTIAELLEKYKNESYIIQRINAHINNYLPNTLENELKNHEKRINRNTYLTEEQMVFIQIFLSKTQYFYLSNNNCFYEYNGKHYTIVKEDEIIHKLLSSISKERILLDWKHKTKQNVIRLIKERSLYSSIPESDTIQTMLRCFHPVFFQKKNEAKYFFTILGDNILKKNNHLIFLVSPKMKKIIQEIENIAYLSIGCNNISHNFMTKYHENHSYENCRLVKMNESFDLESWLSSIIKRCGLDLLCIATHYSNRFSNSDNFLDTKADEDLQKYSYYLKDKSVKEIAGKFIVKCLQTIQNSNVKLEWKNIHFIWKQYLNEFSLPNMMYSNTLKNILKEIYEYDESTDSFIGITSKYLPIESDFLKFWETNIHVSTNETFDDELEIDELCTLFKYWVKQTDTPLLSNGSITEDNVLKILKHYYNTAEIIDDKYILDIYCDLWDKNGDIKKSFDFMKDEVMKNHKLALISFDEAYNYYYKFCNSINQKMVASKHYFEKYLYNKIPDHIVYEKFIETSWVLQNSLL